MPPIEDDLEQDLQRRADIRRKITSEEAHENLGDATLAHALAHARTRRDSESILDKLLHLVGAGKKNGGKAADQSSALRSSP